MQPIPVFQSALRRFAPEPVAGALGKLLRFERLEEVVQGVRAQQNAGAFPEEMLRALRVSIRVEPADMARIPAAGPLVVVANHPYGLVEGAVLQSMLARVRPDVRLLANSMLGMVPELRASLILVDPFGGAARENARGLREARQWLRNGGALAVFPAGEVSHADWGQREIVDPPWNDAAMRLARQCGARVVPVYFSGCNSALFQIAGLVHPRLRTALLPHELLNKCDTEIEARVGHAVSSEDHSTAELRRRTYWLSERKPPKPRVVRRMRPVGPAIPGEWMEKELLALPSERLLISAGPLRVYCANAEDVPLTLRETGRLREVTFRAAGEGTGRPYDLDRFDSWYDHLVLWHAERRQVAGAYRLCGADVGRELYASTLFRFSDAFFHRLGPALELGRSFVAPEFQRGFQPLLLLWKAIGQYVVARPRYRFLFGPVSVSADYCPASRALLARFLADHCFDGQLSQWAAARSPYRGKPSADWPRPADVDDLDRLIRELEPDGKGVPVLVRQYLKLGGKLCGFHLDRGFGDCLDGLIVVDLERCEQKQLERYLGREGARAVLERANVPASVL
ncbi:GNAT family N-acyltransferase [uncultured Paludibaculum sp.]|uniref:lysophospholipid acyltransferase family protein n=1 Tax=uncultured Paludibaculum sp. TaxID=1765020 RepID=UPI002AAB8C08|nr:GNAT family N-acyltransferase [uncultured Paludibaculum sp.]